MKLILGNKMQHNNVTRLIQCNHYYFWDKWPINPFLEFTRYDDRKINFKS